MTRYEDDYDRMRRSECRAMATRLFHVDLPVDEFLCDDIETGEGSYMMLFRGGNEVYALFVAQPGVSQTLADVQRMIKGAGLTVDKYLPPEADLTYFYQNAVTLIKERYPARRRWTVEDLRYYSRNVSYSPALVRVSAINGALRRYNRTGQTWQDVKDFSFRKVRVVYA